MKPKISSISSNLAQLLRNLISKLLYKFLVSQKTQLKHLSNNCIKFLMQMELIPLDLKISREFATWLERNSQHIKLIKWLIMLIRTETEELTMKNLLQLLPSNIQRYEHEKVGETKRWCDEWTNLFKLHIIFY